MPCRSYEDDFHVNNGEIQRIKDNADKLARISCRALRALEDLAEGAGIDSTIDSVLSNPEVRVWWEAHKAADAAEQERIRKLEEALLAKEEKRRKKEEILSKLTPEELKILGVK